MDDHHVTARKAGLALCLLTVVAGVMLALGSCTAGGDRSSAIPAAPADARELTGDEVPFSPEVVAEGFRSSLDASTVEIQVYSLPVDSTFAPIAAHYDSQLSGRWLEQSSVALETARAEGRDVMLWANDETGEVLSLQYVAAPDRDGNILIVIYAQRE